MKSYLKFQCISIFLFIGLCNSASAQPIVKYADGTETTEPRRVFRRLYNVREEGVYGNQEEVFAGSKGAGTLYL